MGKCNIYFCLVHLLVSWISPQSFQKVYLSRRRTFRSSNSKARRFSRSQVIESSSNSWYASEKGFSTKSIDANHRESVRNNDKSWKALANFRRITANREERIVWCWLKICHRTPPIHVNDIEGAIWALEEEITDSDAWRPVTCSEWMWHEHAFHVSASTYTRANIQHQSRSTLRSAHTFACLKSIAWDRRFYSEFSIRPTRSWRKSKTSASSPKGGGRRSGIMAGKGADEVVGIRTALMSRAYEFAREIRAGQLPTRDIRCITDTAIVSVEKNATIIEIHAYQGRISRRRRNVRRAMRRKRATTYQSHAFVAHVRDRYHRGRRRTWNVGRDGTAGRSEVESTTGRTRRGRRRTVSTGSLAR